MQVQRQPLTHFTYSLPPSKGYGNTFVIDEWWVAVVFELWLCVVAAIEKWLRGVAETKD